MIDNFEVVLFDVYRDFGWGFEAIKYTEKMKKPVAVNTKLNGTNFSYNSTRTGRAVVKKPHLTRKYSVDFKSY